MAAKSVWVKDSEAVVCMSCQSKFSVMRRRHHCRNCGNIFCSQCSSRTFACPQVGGGLSSPQRVCDDCYSLLSGTDSASMPRRSSIPSFDSGTDIPRSRVSSRSGMPSPLTGSPEFQLNDILAIILAGDLDQFVTYCAMHPTVDVNALAADQLPYLHHATASGHSALCRALLDAGAIVDFRSPAGETALHVAARLGRDQCGSVLVAAGADANVLTPTPAGQSPLHLGAFAGHTNMCRVLLDAAADINATTPDQHTALHGALVRGRTETCRLLIERGCDVSTANRDGRTPLHTAAERNATVLQSLLERGASVHAVDAVHKRTPLHCAARQGQLASVQALLTFGAARNVIDAHGKTPADLARDEGFTRTAETLEASP
eukprot:TRINITY_DN10814_c0_g1_i2.p1 TRINITY_DN10814_c0_g1~~TRINITY_DN10814_c0_g1_i2.p1  ORF type:complete len:375 (+),score=43.01 TRINITY_DN10814_c0_g1_i2:292-1416(+)